jgi:hypothetical protein
MLSPEVLALLPGQPVLDRDGEKIGKVLDVFTPEAGVVEVFASVSSSLLGMRASLVPLYDARLDGTELRVPYLKADVKAAPRVEVDDELAPTDVEELLRYYRGLATGSDPDRPQSEPSSDETVPSTSVVTIAVTSTSAQGLAITGDEAAVVSDALADTIGELVEKTMTELRDDPTLPSATATVQVELTEEPDGPAVARASVSE